MGFGRRKRGLDSQTDVFSQAIPPISHLRQKLAEQEQACAQRSQKLAALRAEAAHVEATLALAQQL